MPSDDHEYYLEQGLQNLVDLKENADYTEGVFDSVSGKLGIPFPPQLEDLVRLHRLIRSRKSFTVLEFGTGYSTAIIADALAKNERDWEALPQKPAIRNRFMFQVFSVDASQPWIDETKSRFSAELLPRVHFSHSSIKIGTYCGQLCHYYEQLPDIVPDFIYLDGPAAKDVQGTLNGVSFQCDERTVMSGDLLLLEPTFLPGTFILVDGRTNNARFLARNFKRPFKIHWDKHRDVTTMELDEDRLGKYNLLGADFFPAC
jgi:hypothetical protein